MQILIWLSLQKLKTNEIEKTPSASLSGRRGLLRVWVDRVRVVVAGVAAGGDCGWRCFGVAHLEWRFWGGGWRWCGRSGSCGVAYLGKSTFTSTIPGKVVNLVQRAWESGKSHPRHLGESSIDRKSVV